MSAKKKDIKRLNAAKALEAIMNTSSGPLGHSTDEPQHYIRPVPPTYVTEYESSYTWPKIQTYAPDPDRLQANSPLAPHRRTTTLGTYGGCSNTVAPAVVATETEEDAVWAEAEREIDAMLQLNRTRSMIDGDGSTTAEELRRATHEHQQDNKQLNSLYNRAKLSVAQREEAHKAHALNRQFVKTMEQIKPS